MILLLLDQACSKIQPLSSMWHDRAVQRLAQLTMPYWAMGRLMNLSARLAAMTHTLSPRVKSAAIVPFCADHGMFRPAITNSPQIVTEEVAVNMASGSATVCLLAHQVNSEVFPVDVGVLGDLERACEDRLFRRKIARATGDIAVGPAMTEQQALRSVEVGIEVAFELAHRFDALAAGEMGVCNTTASSAMVASLLDVPVWSVTGFGSGIPAERFDTKVRFIEDSLALNKPDGRDGLDVLRCVGGFEIGAMAGLMLGGAACGKPVILDGLVAGAAALLARNLAPHSVDYMVAAHRSSEQGHSAVLEALGLEPLLDLDLHLGEGAGCALAVPLLRAAASLLSLPTFEESGVTEVDKS